MWGVCPNGTEAVGCGRSETFRNCADVSVITSTGGLPPAFAIDFRRDYPFLLYYRDLSMPRNVYPLVVRWERLQYWSTFVLFLSILCVLYVIASLSVVSLYVYLIIYVSTVYNVLCILWLNISDKN